MAMADDATASSVAAVGEGVSGSSVVPAPSRWESDVTLTDGSILHVRPIAHDDADRLVAFHETLSPESVRMRYLGQHPTLGEGEVEHLVGVDRHDRAALVALRDDHIVGVARYDRVGVTDVAEVALLVRDDLQGHGVGTLLLEHLAAAARGQGIVRFVAYTLAENRPMLAVLAAAGFDELTDIDGIVLRVELRIEPTERTRAAIAHREHVADATSITRLLRPRSVAVIGASRTPGSVGHQVLENLLAGGFDGPVFPVNPSCGHVASIKAYPTIVDVPDAVDLAVIAVPGPAVAGVIDECGAKGVAGVVVLSAGFGEVGRVEEEIELRRRALDHGMRLVGPNCIGVVNTGIGLNATFAPEVPVPGRVAMQSQSGALGITLLERSARLGLGVSTFVSVGNKADVSGNDLLQYWEDDPATDVVLLYLESVGNPRKFARIARRVSRRKPIVAVKAGRSVVGARAASSHTAAMASADVAVDALFRQAGVIRVDTVDELFDTARLLSAQPLPAGRRVAILSNAGGPGILAADACVAAGLDVPELAAGTRARLRAVLDPNATVANPADLVASATPSTYEEAVRIVLDDEGVDALIVISVPTFAAPSRGVADALRRAVPVSCETTVVGCFLAAEDVPPLLVADPTANAIPVFSTPEPAARALGRAAAHAEWRARPAGTLPELVDLELDTARAIVHSFLDQEPGGGWLDPDTIEHLLRATGIASPRSAVVTGADDARTAAAGFTGPVALKASGPDLVHKSDVGGVVLDLATPGEVADAYRSMADRIGARMTGALVQEMAPPGVEMIVGVVLDRLFGPLVMVGLGGTSAELFQDRAFRILPLTDVDAADLVRSLRSSPLLLGHRGAAPAAVGALEGVLQRIARLAAAVPELAELEINPLVVTADGVVAVDARARAAPVAVGPPDDLRRIGGGSPG
jgi:acetyl coenzyme A synthetase (ADP forming)-like protein